MSHTFRSDKVRFIANSDLSGDVTIRIPKPDVEAADPTRENFFEDECVSITIPGEALISFVADLMRSKKMAKIEQLTDEEILNI